MFVHTVYFWLNDSARAEAQPNLLRDCHELLGKIPTVKSLWAGKPAMTPREVVDNSYAVGLTVLLEDEPGHRIYQDHPLHLQFIERNKANWKRVQVYDFNF